MSIFLSLSAHSDQKQPKNFDEVLLAKAIVRKVFDGEMSIRT